MTNENRDQQDLDALARIAKQEEQSSQQDLDTLARIAKQEEQSSQQDLDTLARIATHKEHQALREKSDAPESTGRTYKEHLEFRKMLESQKSPEERLNEDLLEQQGIDEASEIREAMKQAERDALKEVVNSLLTASQQENIPLHRNAVNLLTERETTKLVKKAGVDRIIAEVKENTFKKVLNGTIDLDEDFDRIIKGEVTRVWEGEYTTYRNIEQPRASRLEADHKEALALAEKHAKHKRENPISTDFRKKD